MLRQRLPQLLKGFSRQPLLPPPGHLDLCCQSSLTGSLSRLFQTAADAAGAGTAQLAAARSTIPLRTGRPRLVVLGTGWGGARLVRDIDPTKYDITVISPRNHMVFTPLLASSCVGTVETRSIAVPIIDIQKALRYPQNSFYAAEVTSVHPEDRMVECVSADKIRFFVEYDVLAISTGSQGSTFGIPGVEQHTYFLRDADNATVIRNALIDNWNRANIPGRSPAERDRLLHTVVVGGGPTGVEFAGELADFINRDLQKIDPDRARDMRVTVIEANELLGSFDARLREYAARKLVRAGVHLMRGIVKEVREKELELKVSSGADAWFLPSCAACFPTAGGKGRIAIDDHLRVLAPPKQTADGHVRGPGEKTAGPQEMHHVSMVQDEEPSDLHKAGSVVPSVFALGDCCADLDHPLPALAQVAEQQGKYLARCLNASFNATSGPGCSDDAPAFEYRSMGAMASVGGRSAILELGSSSAPTFSWGGFSSWVAWRSAYLTRLGTIKNRLYVATNWTLTLLFGRDVSRY
ncbi:hypothetical protein N2152v2_007850 [Parachlorella kessleri]